MAKGTTRKPYRMRFTDKELQEKPYRKYRYPQEIDGITFEDDVEKKLSESSWFRCLKPEQQIVVEKQMRLRAKGEYDKKILHYEDKLNEAALGFSKPTMTRLVQSLSPTDMKLFFSLLPYTHINDGMLRNKDRQLLTPELLSQISKLSVNTIDEKLKEFDEKRLIFIVQSERLEAPNKDDIYLTFLERISTATRTTIDNKRPYIIYINPFIVFFGQYIDKYVVPYFVNSGWYVINPYADRIADWIEHNCLSPKIP